MKSIRKGLVASLTDQALLSLLNLSIGIFLIKHTSKEDYGLYVVGFAVLLFAASVQNALISTPMTVLAPRKTERDTFCSQLAGGQYLIFFPVMLIAVPATALAASVAPFASAPFDLVVILAAAILGMVLREFFRTFFFLRLSTNRVLLVDSLYVTLVLFGLWLASMVFPGQLYLAALAVLGIASLMAGILGIWLSGLRVAVSPAGSLAALRECWPHGRWTLAGVTVTWIQDQSYVYLLALLAGTWATAEANAARLFFAPLALLNTSIARVMMPRWARMYYEGKIEAIQRIARKSQLLLLPIVLIYVVLVWLFRQPITGALLTDEYSNIGGLMALWAGVFVVQAVRSNFSVVLQALHKFRELTLINAVSAVAVILLSAITVGVYGVHASISALLVGEAVLTTLMALTLRTAVRQSRPT